MRPRFKGINRVDTARDKSTRGPAEPVGLNGKPSPDLEPFRTGPFNPLDKVMTSSEPNNMVMEHYRKLYVKLFHIGRESELQTIAITSALPCEGKTLTSINLGLVMARDMDRPVLLVDCDMRRPQVSAMLGIEEKGPGLAEVLAGSASVEDSVVRLLGENLYILPAGRIPSNPTELLFNKMERFTSRMREIFSFIIIDTPPVVPMPDQHLLSSIVDGFILVVLAGKTPREALSTALDSLSECNVLGLVFNGMKHTRSTNYYYNNYYSKRKGGS